MADAPKFEKLTIQQFLDVLSQFPFRRRINAVHMHHTWRPRWEDYFRDPERCIEGMWRFHTQQRKFSDIAQHITIAPDGTIWMGRKWDLAPASATGNNGNSAAGPFMFEMIGDFDHGGDPFQDPQRSVTFQVIANVQHRFRLPVESLRFHNQMSAKSCPGTQIQYQEVLEALRPLREALTTQWAPRSVGVFGIEASPQREATQRIVSMMGSTRSLNTTSVNETELPEEELTMEDISVFADETFAGTRAPGLARDLRLSPEQMEKLRPHVVNLRFGAFSSDGQFKTTKTDIDRMFDEDLAAALREAKEQDRKLKLMFYAHGGLVKESVGLQVALDQTEFWTRNGVYPIFFIWETGLLETFSDILKQAVTGTRGFMGDMWDTVLETLARPLGCRSWTQMKRSAEVSVLRGGGALYVAQKAGEFWGRHRDDMEVHAIGHSAGSIFHSHFIPTLLENGVDSVRSLHFLAPAVSCPTFRDNLQPIVGSKIDAMTMFTMSRSYELDDTAGPYQKSLLYLVHHSFEQPDETPILGLEENVRSDDELSRFFGLRGSTSAKAEIVFSVSDQDGNLRSRSESRKHGDFDNDRPTMNSVARRIMGADDSVSIFEYPLRARALVDAELMAFQRSSSTMEDFAAAPVAMPLSSAELERPPAAPRPQGMPASASPVTVAAGRKNALCVGINEYPSPNELHGCVPDARNWGTTFKSLGFNVEYLLDREATYAAIIGRLRQLVQSSSPGDVVAFQYSGHGTSLKDLNGDETDGTDEALCPYDMATGGFVIDDDLRAIFLSIPDGVNFTCFIDCCHSGTITRLVAGLSPANAHAGVSKARFIRPTPEMEEAHRNFRSSRRSGPPAPLHGPEQMREVLFSACLPEQVAYETGGNGDFTSRALPLLRSGYGKLTNIGFQEQVTAAFGAAARQHPNIDCAASARSRILLAPIVATVGVLSIPGTTTSTGATSVSAPVDWDSIADNLRATADLIEEKL